MASTTPKRISGPAAVVGTTSGAPTTLVTVPTSHTYVVKQITFCNVTASACNLSIGIGSPVSPNLIMAARSVPANTDVQINLALVLVAAETVQAFASIASAINITLEGWDYAA